MSGQDVDAPFTRTAGRLGRVATTPLTDVGVGRHDDQPVLLRLRNTVRRLWNREREMVYLATHSTHFIYGYMERERNVLFNNALNTFYLRLYGEREREMFYLTTHSTHFIYGYMEREREKWFI